MKTSFWISNKNEKNYAKYKIKYVRNESSNNNFYLHNPQKYLSKLMFFVAWLVATFRSKLWFEPVQYLEFTQDSLTFFESILVVVNHH